MKNPSYKIIIPILLAIIDLFTLIFLKHYLNEIKIKDINIFFIGNLFNILVYLILIFLIFLYFVKQSKGIFNLKYLSFFLFLSILFHLSVLGTGKIKIRIEELNVFSYNLDNVLPFILHSFSLTIILTIIFYLIEKIKKSEKFLLLSSIYNSLISVIFIFIVVFLIAFEKTDDFEIQSPDKKSIVVMGAAVIKKNEPSPILKGRLNKAYSIFKKSKNSMIYLTGSKSEGEISEAKAGYNYLYYSKGINPVYLSYEEDTRTSLEQIKYIRNKIQPLGGIIIIVSDDFHLFRLKEMCSFYKINANFAASDFVLTTEKRLYYRLRDTLGLLIFWNFAV